MKKAISIAVLLGMACVMTLYGMTVLGYIDLQMRASAPLNAPPGFLRPWADSSSLKIKCITPAGTACYFDASAGSSLTLQTNGINNASQSVLNLVSGTGATVTNTGTGNVRIDFSGAAGGGLNAQTGSYTALSTDSGKLIAFNCASACALTLPSSPPGATWWLAAQERGVGALAILPNGLNLDGGSGSLTVNQGQGLLIYTDGSNYFTMRGMGSGGLTTLTTTGTSGAATLSGGVLNIPVYAGGGGSGGSVEWDDPPASPTAYDDEFSGSSLSSQWTVASNTASSVLFGTLYPGMLCVKTTGSSQAYQVYETFSPGSSDFSIFFRVTGDLVANYSNVGIQVGAEHAGATNLNDWQVVLQYNSGFKLTAHKWVAGTATFNVINFGSLSSPSSYVLLQRVSGVWSLWASGEGPALWALSTNMGFAPTVNYISFFVSSDSQTAPMIGGIDFVRVNQFFHP